MKFRSVRLQSAVVLVAASLAVLGACGGHETAASTSQSGSPLVSTSPTVPASHTSSSGSLKTYTNGLGFSLTYDGRRLRRVNDNAGADSYPFGITTDGPAYRLVAGGNVIILDRDRKDRWGNARGGLTVMAAQAAQPVRPPSLAVLRQARDLFWWHRRSVTTVHMAGRPTSIEPLTVNGVSGYKLVQHGDGLVYVLYALFHGKSVYLLNCNATAETWPSIGPVLEAAARSFRVTS